MHRRVYTEKPLHRVAFAHGSLSRSEPFAQSSFYTAKPYTDYAERLLGTDAFTQRNLYTEEPLRTDAFTQRSLYTEELLHTESCTHRPVHTQEVLQTDNFMARRTFT